MKQGRQELKIETVDIESFAESFESEAAFAFCIRSQNSLKVDVWKLAANHLAKFVKRVFKLF